jgi:hypothetical protein
MSGPTNARRRASGAAGCVLALLVVFAAAGLLVSSVLLWRRPGEAVGLEVELVGGTLESAGEAEASYVPRADIPLLTVALDGTRRSFEVRSPVRLGERATVVFAQRLLSIRAERLHRVQLELGGRAVSFTALDGSADLASADLASADLVAMEGSLAVLRAHALFLPPTIHFARDAGTVRAVVDVRPITVARLVPGAGSDASVQAPPGTTLALRVTVRRTGAGWPAACFETGPVSDASAELLVLSRAALEDVLGAPLRTSRLVPATRAQWASLGARRDARFVVRSAADDPRMFELDVPASAPPGELLAMVAAFEPGEDLAAAAVTAVVIGAQTP